MTTFADPTVGWPEVAVLPVTYLCNANCDMCALGDLKQSERLSDEQLEHIFGNPAVCDHLRAINFTGGEPTLRKDLAQLVGRLIDTCPKLESVSLNSNGMLRTSYRIILETLDAARARGVKLYLYISLDGLGSLHDDIRGVAGAFDRTVRTIDQLRGLQIPKEEFSLNISATATVKNIDHLGEVLGFAVERGIGVSFTYPMATDVYMNNSDRLERFVSDPTLVSRFCDFLDTLEDFQEHISPPIAFYRSLKVTLEGGKRTAPCIFRRGGFFLEPTGDVRPCWRSSELLFGSIHEDPIDQIWTGQARLKVIASIKEDFCDSCPSPCYVGFPSELLSH